MKTVETLPKLHARIRLHHDVTDRPTKLLAFAELTIADAFVIKNIRILKRTEPGHDDPFVVFPSEKGQGTPTDRWNDLAHPTTAEAREAAINLILDAYRDALEANR